jgi:arylformamidase
MRRIWDISQTLSPATPVWPGEAPCHLERTAVISPGCPVNVSRLHISSHAGAHADSPFHYHNDGQDSAQCDLGPYLGRCRVIDVRHVRGCVRLQDFDSDLLKQSPRVLFRTYDRFPHTEWISDFTAIGADVITAFAEAGGVLVGTDAPSLDPESSKTLDAHQAVLAGGLRILEGLVLDDVAEGEYELIALPLKIAGADSSPVRAILREL